VGTASVNGFDCRFTIGTGAGEARGLVCRASYCVARARTARPAAPAGLQEQLDALPDAGKALVGPAQQAAPPATYSSASYGAPPSLIPASWKCAMCSSAARMSHPTAKRYARSARHADRAGVFSVTSRCA